MEEKLILTVPDSWEDVTIDQFQEINTLTSEGTEKTIDIISIFLNEDPELIKKFDITTYTKLISMLGWSNEMPSDANYKPILKIKDQEYGLIPRLNTLLLGEWMDLEHYINEDPIQNIHFIMSILYRPLITAFNDRDRLIEPYDAEVMVRQAELFKKHIKIGEVYGALVFFYLIASNSMQIMKDYLHQEQVAMMKN